MMIEILNFAMYKMTLQIFHKYYTKLIHQIYDIIFHYNVINGLSDVQKDGEIQV